MCNVASVACVLSHNKEQFMTTNSCDERQYNHPLTHFAWLAWKAQITGKKKHVGNTSIVHIPTAHCDDITDSSVSLPVYNVAGRQQFP